MDFDKGFALSVEEAAGVSLDRLESMAALDPVSEPRMGKNSYGFGLRQDFAGVWSGAHYAIFARYPS